MNKLKASEVFKSIPCGLIKSIDESEVNDRFDDGVTPYDFVCNVLKSYDTNQARIAELEETVIRLNDIIAKSTVGANSLGSRENTPNIDERQEVPMIITAGCYCTDIETEAQYIATCEALVRLGVPVGEYNKNSYTGEYASLKNVGWCLNDGAIYHSLYKSLQDSAPDEYIFTTLMPHRDIIKAAEDL